MKLLLSTLISIFFYVTLNAQCSPDTLITSPGIYPDEITNLDEAFVGQPYLTQIDVLCPLDTQVSLSGLTVNVTISAIDLTGVVGLPNNFSYSCNPPNCSFSGGSYACAEIFSTVNPSSADVGYYPLVMYTSTLAINVPLIGSLTQLDTVDYFYIDISNSTASLEQVNSSTFELMDVYPNPVSGKANFQFVIGKNEKVDFILYDCLGKVVDQRIIYANRGVNRFDIDVSSYSSSLYTYSIFSSNDFLSKKIFVSNP